MWTSFCIFTALVGSIECYKNIKGAKLSESSDIAAKVFSCQPNITYVHDHKICVCTNNGLWPKNCTTFEKLYNDKGIRNKCEKNSYVSVYCNICKCNQKGQLDYQKCTKHTCETGNESPKSRKFTESIKGKCDPKIWYSFAPCQLCYCINDDKLICNRINNKMNTLALGAHNFTVCGDMFLKDTIDLIPNADQFLRLGNSYIGTEPINVIDDIKEAQPPREDESNIINQSNTDESNEAFNFVKGSSNKKKVDSNSVDTDEEDTYTVDSRTQMPEYDKPASEEVTEHVNKQKIKESGSEEVDALINTVPTVFSPDQVEENKEAVSPSILRDLKSGSAYKHSKESVSMFKMNLPNILKNIMNINFRRDHERKMVSLDSGSSCEPGTKVAVKCNTCFCMRNGKLLCTMKLCVDEFSEII